MGTELIWVKSYWKWFLIKATEILLRFYRNLIKVSVLAESEWDFKQNLNWGCGIDSKKLYKDWYRVQKWWDLKYEIY